MRRIALFCLCALLTGGCAGKKPANTKSAGPAAGTPASVSPAGQTNRSELIVTPSAQVQGRVALVNPKARYVVVSFPIGAVPAIQQRMHVFRSGLKVGEIKITGPQRDFNIAADIIDGECQIGDEVREN